MTGAHERRSRRSSPDAEASDLLYAAVAFGMLGYVRAGFLAEAIAPPRYADGFPAGSILIATHRADSDVPLFCAFGYVMARYWRKVVRPTAPHFVARDDLFERGFFAGFLPSLPRPLRRVLFPVSAARALPLVRVHPVPHPSADELKLVQALRGLPPVTPLEEVLPVPMAELFAHRARQARLRPPQRVADVLCGTYADLLWHSCTRSELSGPVWEPVWRERRRVAAGALRSLVELVQRGGTLLLFPEGRPSPDGSIGPLRGGLRALVHRGRPSAVIPIGIAYDALRRGRSRAIIAFGEPVPDITADTEGAALRAMRAMVPLTCGQVVASALLEASDTGAGSLSVAALEQAVWEARAAADATGRPIEEALRAGRIRERVQEAVGAVTKWGLGARSGSNVELDPARVASAPLLRRLAREYESARDLT